MMTITIEIPALDRLCGILEGWQRAGICQEIEDEIVGKLKAAAEGGVPKPEFKEVPAGEDHPWKDETKVAPEPREAAQEPSKTSSVTADAVPPSPEGKAPMVTLEAIQLAAAQMRDQGKLKAVTDLFPEFGIKKLSDLKGDKLQAFGERLRAMGAKV